MSALDEANKAAARASGVPTGPTWIAIRAFLAHLADNLPDEMVEAGACALAVQDGWCTEKQWSEEVDPDESRQWDERVCPVLFAALRSLTTERVST